MANYDYEIINGRKIRVRPKETVSEIDKNGYFRRQPNHFTTPFGDGENDLKAEGNKRYRLVWAKLCHWSNRAAIVRELEGLEDQISVNMVEHAPHEKNLGWEYVYNENNIDPVLGDQFLSEAYYRADDDYQGRTTVPALIDTTTGKVVNNDYNWLTTYFEVNFRPWHKKGAPELYPVELREEIDKMNDWEGAQLNKAKEILAYELTKLVHGEEEAKKAEETARSIFTGGDAQNMPSAVISKESFKDGNIDIISIVHQAGLASSRSEARRAVEQGGVSVNGEKVSAIDAVFAMELFEDGVVVKKGKKNFRKVTV